MNKTEKLTESQEQAVRALEADIRQRFGRENLQIKPLPSRFTEDEAVYAFHICDTVSPPGKEIIDYAHQKILELQPRWTIRVHV